MQFFPLHGSINFPEDVENSVVYTKTSLFTVSKLRGQYIHQFFSLRFHAYCLNYIVWKMRAIKGTMLFGLLQWRAK